jgi:hypothetical protein
MHPNNVKLAQAFACMRYGSGFHRRCFTSHGFAAARKAHGFETSHRMRENNPMRNKKTAAKISLIKTGTALSDETRKKISNSKRGISHGHRTEETKSRQRGVEYHDPVSLRTVRVKLHLGEVVPDGFVKGRHLTVKQIWITDGEQNMRVNLDFVVPDGFRRGRTLAQDSNGRIQPCQH